MEKSLKFQPPKDFDEKKFFLELSARYRLVSAPQSKTRQIYYDTFDWRLYTHQLALLESSNLLTLWRFNEQIASCSVKGFSTPIFIWTLPDGTLKVYVKSILGPRALLKLFETNSQSTIYRILNPMQKTVARLRYEQVELVKNQRRISLGTQLSIHPMKGYNRVTSDLAKWIVDHKFIPSKDDIYHQALELLKKKPGGYTAKPKEQLSPTTPSATAVKSTLRFLLKVIQQNEDGIKNDVDTEFLHDFRVAIRRTRSILSQLKFVFPPDATQYYKKSFSNLGRMTNRLRDLDVYLLEKENYRKMLPEFFKSDIEPLFANLQKERQTEFVKVVHGLESREYRQTLKRWNKFLSQSKDDYHSARNAEKPILSLARERIYWKYRAVVKLGKTIDNEAEDEILHDLRVECKKLRYLLEFFYSLFLQTEMKRLITPLKKLQDNLGRFQDLCVHELAFQEFVTKLPCKNLSSKRTMMATGSLIDRLDLEKQKVRRRFSNVFAEFSSSTNTALFIKLFSTPEQENVQ